MDEMYRRLLRPLLFSLPASTAHRLGMAALWPLEHVGPLRALVGAALAPPSDGAAVDAMGLRFTSPVGLAGGFDKNATRARALSALGFGFLELGTVTALGQDPNPEPNLFRLPADHALVNRLGFPNEGAAVVAARLLARRRSADPPPMVPIPIGLSIGKSRAVDVNDLDAVRGDYRASFTEVRRVADFVVVNISSPNTKDLRSLQGPEVARQLFTDLMELGRAHEIHEGRRVPVLVKVAPDLTDDDYEELLGVVDATSLDGLVATNTTVRREGLQSRDDEIAAAGAGGLSGPPLRPRALFMVKRARERLGPKVAIVGVGGIETATDARAYLEAGANLVQLYTGFVYGGPLTAWRLVRTLARS